MGVSEFSLVAIAQGKRQAQWRRVGVCVSFNTGEAVEVDDSDGVYADDLNMGCVWVRECKAKPRRVTL